MGLGSIFLTVTNLHECVFYLIACDLLSLVSLLDGIPCEVKAFPCKYLALPLNVMPLRWVQVQPLIDKVVAKLLNWKAKLLDRHGRLRACLVL